DFIEGTVERGGLTGAGWSRDQDNSVRSINHLPKSVVGVRQHPDVCEVEDHPALVEKTEDDAFSMNHRDDGDADIDFAVVDAHLDAAILGQAFLGDVQPGHDLEPTDDGRLEAINFRRQGLRLQKTVNAVTNLQAVFARLD